MARNKVFISYNRAEKQYLDELLPVLRAARGIADVLWFDEQEIDIGDKFHGHIQQALAETGVGILLVSNRFFTSDYIKRHELPYLVQQAEQSMLKLGCLYVTSISDTAFEVTIEIDGQQRTVNLKDYLGAHRPDKPLNRLSEGERDEIYAKLANWVTQQLSVRIDPPQRHPGPRFELAITLRARRDHWEHRFSLPHANDFTRPVLDCLSPEQLFAYPGYLVDGEDLFQLLFGSDTQKSGEILAAAFDAGVTADPTRYPLRLRLLLDDNRLYALPWARISYQGRRLADLGWTVELHPDSEARFPEYPPHTCYFPGKVVLIGARESVQTPQGAAHLHDLQRFFQRHWQKAPEPILASTAAELRAALRSGATRCVYYYGAVSPDGLLLEGAESSFPWSEWVELLQQSRSVSTVFLNLLGEVGFDAISRGRDLLAGAMAVLVQCNERTAAPAAAKAALGWLHSVFAASELLDPVVALHQHQQGQVAAWTRYSTWQTVAPQRIEMPELVNLLLDRRSQRAELAHAKDEFYTYKMRRIYHTVAFGTAGCKVTDFPRMASQHLRDKKREQEVILHRSLSITPRLNTVQRVDDLVHQQLGVSARQSVIPALLQQDTMSSNNFWFLVLGWMLPQPLADVADSAALLRAIAEWCRTRLFQELLAANQNTNVRVLSIVAIEAQSEEDVEILEAHITELIDTLNDEEGFRVGELERLAGVRLQDLRNYFQDRQTCSCDDRYRQEFPRLLLGQRQEMPFDQAVDTIKRGESDNWGNLFEELQDMIASGDWPPAVYEPTFWESRDGRR
jgi:TIR domain